MRHGIVILAALMAIPAMAQAGPREDVVDSLVKCTYLQSDAARLACFDHDTPALRAAAKTPSAGQPAMEAAPEPAEPPKATALAAPPPAALLAPKEPPPEQSGGSWFAALNPLAGIGAPPKPTAKQMAYQPIGEEILPITIAVKEFYVPLGGAFMVTLANGQVWRAVHGYTVPPKFQEGQTNLVSIDHAMLGGHNLSLYGSSTLYKVERVQ